LACDIWRARSRAFRQAGVAVLQQLARDLRLGVQEEREDVDLGVPEIVAFVALAGHALGGDVGLAVAAHRLQQVELVEAHALLQRVVAGDLDVGLGPEVGQVAACAAAQRLEAAGARVRPAWRALRHSSAFRVVARRVIAAEFVQAHRLALLAAQFEAWKALAFLPCASLGQPRRRSRCLDRADQQ
jgi:pimeloyl-ACP methyl ester carboxylesterase